LSQSQGTVIPCIDVMGGKVVQLIKGETKAVELESADTAIEMFRGFPLLHIIDLDAAMGNGSNHSLVKYLLKNVRARVGGGVRTTEDARTLVALGAEQVIVATRAFGPDGIDEGFLAPLRDAIGREKVVVAIDVKGGNIAVRGWKGSVAMTPEDVVGPLEPYCTGFLCTYVDGEGMLEGTDLPLFLSLKAKTDLGLTAAGGITSMEEVRALLAAGIDVALGMAVYTGKLSLDELRALL
jgi:phosphoribosylformimino-5-aminoimidazole carboxamide ribotide isomerase